MRQRNILSERYPTFFVYSGERLTAEEQMSAGFDQRVSSIWKFLCRKVLEFQESLRPRERANVDPEDTLLRVYIVLKKKDSKYNPKRSRYITFAGVILKREFLSIREQARVVHGPRNSMCRLVSYADEEDSGRRTEVRDATARSIRAAMGPQEGWTRDAESAGCAGADEHAEGVERRRIARSAVMSLMRGLSPAEAEVVGKRHGLWGKPEMTIRQIATESGRSIAQVQDVERMALGKMRDLLNERRHTSANESDEQD